MIIVSRRLNLLQSAPKCNLYLASALAQLDHEIHVLTSMIAPQASMKLKEAGAIIHKTPRFFASRQMSPFLYTQLVQRIKHKFSADIVLGNGYTLFDDVTWIHFSRLASIARLGYRSWKLYAEAVLEKLLYRTSSLLLAPSSIVAQDLSRLCGLPSTKILVQPHGVDTKYYSFVAKRRKGIVGAEGKVCLLFVGADPLRKGFHLLLKSLASMRDIGNLRLVAVGFNPNSNLLSLADKHGLKRTVSFEGIVTTEELVQLYQSSDIYVLPSLYDPFSIATLEAMATGLPAVISHYTGVKDIVRNWHDAILIDPLDTGQFAEVLSVLAYDEKLRRRIGINARITAERFSWQNVAKDVSKAFEGNLKG